MGTICPHVAITSLLHRKNISLNNKLCRFLKIFSCSFSTTYKKNWNYYRFSACDFRTKSRKLSKKHGQHTHKISKKTVQKHDFSIYSKSMVYKKRKFAIYLKIYKVKISITKKQNPKGVQVWRYVRAYRRAYIPRRAPLPMYTVWNSNARKRKTNKNRPILNDWAVKCTNMHTTRWTPENGRTVTYSRVSYTSTYRILFWGIGVWRVP